MAIFVKKAKKNTFELATESSYRLQSTVDVEVSLSAQ